MRNHSHSRHEHLFWNQTQTVLNCAVFHTRAQENVSVFKDLAQTVSEFVFFCAFGRRSFWDHELNRTSEQVSWIWWSHSGNSRTRTWSWVKYSSKHLTSLSPVFSFFCKFETLYVKNGGSCMRACQNMQNITSALHQACCMPTSVVHHMWMYNPKNFRKAHKGDKSELLAQAKIFDTAISRFTKGNQSKKVLWRWSVRCFVVEWADISIGATTAKCVVWRRHNASQNEAVFLSRFVIWKAYLDFYDCVQTCVLPGHDWTSHNWSLSLPISGQVQSQDLFSSRHWSRRGRRFRLQKVQESAAVPESCSWMSAALPSSMQPRTNSKMGA